MVSYRVRRLHTPDEDARRYHLYDRADQLLLVADLGSPWLPDTSDRQVCFGRPDGEAVATMDLPRPDERRPERARSYAVIFEHAVYALITAHGAPEPLTRQRLVPPFDRLVIEVEGNRWLALRWTEHQGPLLVIYDMDASDLSVHVDPEADELPEPIGLLEAGPGEYDLDLTLPAGRVGHAALLGLALVFLTDASL